MYALLRISCPNFVAGAIVRAGIITETAPILRRWRGHSFAALRAHTEKHRWQLELLLDRPDQLPG